MLTFNIPAGSLIVSKEVKNPLHQANGIILYLVFPEYSR